MGLSRTAHANDNRRWCFVRLGGSVVSSLAKLDTDNLEANLQQNQYMLHDMKTNGIYFVLQIIPPIWPCLFDAALLFEDCLINDSTKYAECHSNTVIIVTMNADATFEITNWLAVYFE